LNKVEPRKAGLRCNLLAKDNWRLALLDEMEPEGPEVPLVSKPERLACRGERLARTASRPNRAVSWPTCCCKGEGPSANAGEEMALGEGDEVGGFDILDRALVDGSRGN
jgi:hypothetical protein